MESSISQIFDPIRRIWVAATPEERIRQRLIQLMIEQLSYPRSLIGVEKELSQLPHLRHMEKQKIPNRRADLIVFATGEFSLRPLLMIECKVASLTPKFAQQVIGYNAFVKAPYLAIANEASVLTGSFDDEAGHFKFEEGLPYYSSLKCAASTFGE